MAKNGFIDFNTKKLAHSPKLDAEHKSLILYEKTNNKKEDDVKIKMSDTNIYYTMMQRCERMLFAWFQPRWR